MYQIDGTAHQRLELVCWEGNTDSAESASGHVFSELTVGLFMRRHPAAYIYNIVIPMCILTSLSLICASNEGVSNSNDRLSNMLALLLTAVAYKFIAAQGLPLLSYLTFLDQYVLTCFTFMVSMVVMNFVSIKMNLSDKSDENLIFGWCALWTVTNLGYFCWGVGHIRDTPPELRGRELSDWVPTKLTQRSRRVAGTDPSALSTPLLAANSRSVYDIYGGGAAE
eukprot:SAG31_NODE_4559_length_3137_cov_8.827189_2_plen_224_part_00